jgi:alcohol dehydrogenase class IV
MSTPVAARIGGLERAVGSAGMAVSTLLKFQAPEIVFGIGSLSEAGYALVRLGARRPLVVSDAGMLAAGWVDELLRILRDAGLRPVLWHDVTANPKERDVAAGFERYRECGADVLVGIGGGSVLDATKAIAVLSGNGGRILDYVGVDRAASPIPPMLMIPATAGTGSDVSQFCIITDTERGVKATIMGRALVPDISLTDPRLLATVPPGLAAATGIDALTHAIESFVSLAHNPLADGHALSAARLVSANLRRAVEAPGDDDALLGMALGALEAGLASSNAILGASSAMSHQVGGLLDLPSGLVNGVLLPHVIRFNAAATPDRFSALALALDLPVEQLPGEDAAYLLAEWVRTLADDVGVSAGLRELGVAPSDVARLARTALDDACLATNPRPTSTADLAALFTAAL